MRDVFVTLRLGAQHRGRFDAETQQLTLVSDNGGEFSAVVIDLQDIDHVLQQIGQAWEAGRIAMEQRAQAIADAVVAADNVTPFKRPGDGA